MQTEGEQAQQIAGDTEVATRFEARPADPPSAFASRHDTAANASAAVEKIDLCIKLTCTRFPSMAIPV